MPDQDAPADAPESSAPTLISSKGKDRPPFSEWLLLPQTLVALSALLLSLCGLFLSIYEASLNRRAQRAAVWPYAEIAGSLGADKIRLWVQNKGIGPARIRAAAVTYRGETKRSWSDLIRSIPGADPAAASFHQSLINGIVLISDSPQENFFSISEGDGDGAAELIEVLGREFLEGRVNVSICYCSVYEDCWTSNLQEMIRRFRGVEGATGPQEVDSCESKEHSRI